jgi:hypothetical protein
MPSYNLTKKNILLTIIRQNSQQTRNVSVTLKLYKRYHFTLHFGLIHNVKH